MAKKLFVGGLSYSTTEDTLRNAFAEIGEVASAAIITDRMTGRSKGFGFIEMVNDADADAAIARLHDQELDGRRLTVNEARPMTERPARNEGGFDRRDQRGGRSW
ncbi:MAG: RNA-binding protein [Candidatus Wildermuthbacteria bacterium]|nr:RNA-binding protein [Candidatus Wildermuthbacteria bacterium]